jgi:hypothetical protein
MGRYLRRPGEALGDLREINAVDLEQRQKELGEKRQPRPRPGQMLGQGGFEKTNGLIHDGPS